MTAQDPVGVVVARFHVPALHPGHVYTLNYVFERHKDVMVILGIPSGYPDSRNPLPYELRYMMLKSTYAGVPLTIVGQKSRRQGNEVRSAHIDKLIAEQFPGRAAIIYGARDSIVHTYEGVHETAEVPTVFHSSATEVRASIQAIDSSDFRAGVIWTMMRRAAVGYPTVDIALLDGDNIWLGRKGDEPTYRFIGGFYDIQIDESFEDAAKRELHEEVLGIESTHPVIIGSRRIDDWRYRRSFDGIITTLTVSRLLGGTPAAADDIVEVRPFPMREHLNVLMPEHVPLGTMLLKHLGLS